MDDVKASKCYVSGMCMQCKVGKVSKFWNRSNQVPHLTQDTLWESDKYTKTLETGEPRSQLFPSRWPQGCMTQTRQYSKDKHIKKIHKRNTTLEWSVRTLPEGLNKFHGTNLTLNSDMDQDTYKFGFAWKIPNLSMNRLQVHINQDYPSKKNQTVKPWWAWQQTQHQAQTLSFIDESLNWSRQSKPPHFLSPLSSY